VVLKAVQRLTGSQIRRLYLKRYFSGLITVKNTQDTAIDYGSNSQTRISNTCAINFGILPNLGGVPHDGPKTKIPNTPLFTIGLGIVVKIC